MRPGWRDILIKMLAQSPLLKLRSPRMTIKNEFCLKYFEAPRVKIYQNLTPTLRSYYINNTSPDESESFIMLRFHNLTNVSLVNALIRSSPPKR